jgi:hypothetical protein
MLKWRRGRTLGEAALSVTWGWSPAVTSRAIPTPGEPEAAQARLVHRVTTHAAPAQPLRGLLLQPISSTVGYHARCLGQVTRLFVDTILGWYQRHLRSGTASSRRAALVCRGMAGRPQPLPRCGLRRPPLRHDVRLLESTQTRERRVRHR